MASAFFFSSSLTSGNAYSPAMPAPIRAGVLGMQRTSLRYPPSQRDSVFSVRPAAMLITSCCCTLIDARALFASCGLTASTTTSERCIAASGAVATCTG